MGQAREAATLTDRADRVGSAPPRHVPAGVAGVAAVIAALAGTLLSLALMIGPYRLASGLLDTADHLDRAEAKLSAGRFVAARFRTFSATAAADRARAGLAASGPLFDVASAVSGIDATVEELPHLVNAAEHSTAAAHGTLAITQNALSGPDKIIAGDPGDHSSETRVRIDRIKEIAKLIDRVRVEVQRTRGELQAVDLRNLPKRFWSPITEGIGRAVKADSALADAQAAFAILPAILGADEPRTYLFGMQNPAELRGTGGALLRYAELTLSEGEAELHKPRTVYKTDINRERLTIRLPKNAWYVAGIEDAQRFGNANWSPDWPTSAKLTIRYGEKAASLNRTTWPKRVDGLIAVDPNVMQGLLKGVGRYETASGRPITSVKVLHFLLYKAYAQFPSTGERRVVLNEVVDKFYARMLKPKQPSVLVQSAGNLLRRKHMQIWLADPAEQRFIERMNWDGGIEPTRGRDYFYVVQQNVGGNKLNYFEDQIHSLDITLSDQDASVSSRVRIFNGALQPLPRYVLGDSNGFHRPMINQYVPRNAVLNDVHVPEKCVVERGPTPCRRDAPAPAVWTDGQPPRHTEIGKRVWSASLEIPPRTSASVGFDYEVPGVVRTVGERNVYRLVIQHQPKVRAETVVVDLRLPPGATAVDAPGWTRRGGSLLWEKTLREDVVLSVSWRE